MTYFIGNFHRIWGAALEHLLITVTALGISVALALPLGIWLVRHRRWYPPVVGFLSVLYTIPSISLLVFLIPVMGLGFWPTVVALVAYNQAILVRNIYVGLTGLDRDMLEAARGMGMSIRQVLWQVELPVALPVILAGVRVAAISTIAIATVAAFFDAGGLGALIREGISQDYDQKIYGAVVALSAIAIGTELVLRLLQRRSQRYRRAGG
jgi:osmoprotectant transport system permease protein